MRAAVEASGLDHGPISVHDKMRTMGLPVVPSTASLSRIFREAGVARLEPKKKPRTWRRFVYPAPNACWQLDATEYVLTGGRRCVIFLQTQTDPGIFVRKSFSTALFSQVGVSVGSGRLDPCPPPLRHSPAPCWIVRSRR